MQNVYEDFVEQVIAVSRSETDYTAILRLLNFTRIEMIHIRTVFRYEQWKKCSEICLP